MPRAQPGADPALRRRRGLRPGGRERRPDGTQLDGFVQVGVAKEDQPHYLKVMARPEADSPPSSLRPRRDRGRGRGGRRRVRRQGVHRPGPNLRVAARPPAGGGGLRRDRDGHAADEGNPRPRRRAGPRAGRPCRTHWRPATWRPTTTGTARDDRRPRRPARGAAAGDRGGDPRPARPRVADRGRDGPRPAAGGALPGQRGHAAGPRDHRGRHRATSSTTSARSATTTARASSGRSTGSAPSATAAARSSA